MTRTDVETWSRAKITTVMAVACSLPLAANALILSGAPMIALVIMVPGFFTSGLMPSAINQILGPKNALDEAQTRLRLSAHEFSFKAISLYLPLCLLALYYLMSIGVLIPLNPSLLLVLALSTILYAATLPQAYLAWAVKPPIQQH